MNNIEKLHLDAIEDSKHLFEEDMGYVVCDNEAASKSAEITEQIAIEFAQWLDYNAQQREYYPMRIMTTKELFQEFLKTKG